MEVSCFRGALFNFVQTKLLPFDSLFKQPRSIFVETKIDQITDGGGRLKKNVGLRSLIRIFKALERLNIVVYLFTFFTEVLKKKRATSSAPTGCRRRGRSGRRGP